MIGVAVVACVFAALAAGATTDPKSDVLRLTDLPSGFKRSHPHYVSKKAAAVGVAPKTFAGFGYVNGYSVEYARSGKTLVGVLKADSNATVYTAPAGAHAALQFVAGNVTSANKDARRLRVGAPLGDESRMYEVTQKTSGISVDVFVVVWRSGRILSTVTAAGVSKAVKPAQVVALAQKQQKHVTG